ncbi:hypothetical protein [Kurthia huakuii]|uniref:hypothetical protein n=1 Tax=Kurthia huakuii TaxID=1421019 RepID=UPI000495223A|nr:hypothetical protein [Kurthia huakuii]MBM7700681.1 hypothetical protein [Kurthia huakuii]
MTISNDGKRTDHIEGYVDPTDLAELKRIYIERAEERLPHYYSPDKQVMLQNMSRDEIYENGLPRDILWKMVEYNLSAKNGISTKRMCTIVEHVDYLASQYVTYHARIHRDFDDDERDEQLNSLREIFNRSFERMTNVFVEGIGDFFARNELPNERPLLFESIQELYRRKIYQYAEYVRLHEDFAQVVGTPEEWLLRDSYFMGDILRLVTLKNGTELPERLYSEHELIAAAAFYQSARKWLIMQKSTSVSEEQLGIELGFFAMKTQVLIEHPQITPGLREKFQIAYNSFYTYKVNDLDKRQREESNNPYAPDKRLYAPIDREAVALWTNKMHKLAIAHAIEPIFTNVVHEAFEVFDEKVRIGSTLERYQDSNEWYRFNQQDDMVSAEADAFTLQLRIADWNKFLNIVKAEKYWFFEIKY